MNLLSPVHRYLGKPALPVLLAAFVLIATGVAQFSSPQPGGDKSLLRPPAGVRVAIWEFEDMQCPDCARANPLLKEAAEKYHIPWLRHDYPLPQHNWSFQAAVNARWFDTKSKKLGDDYRDAVFASQISIENPDGLRAFTQKFAQEHGVALPFAVDPQGKLADLVKADAALGQRIGVEHTPTIWVVTNKTGGGAPPFVEVVDRGKLYSIIDQALADTKPAATTRASAKR
jgi:protein-disulfide isomerase